MDTDVTAAISMGLSILATASSVVLWVLQVWERRPNLRAHWVSLNRFRGHVYPFDDARDVQPLLLRLAVVNASATPDALLEIRFRVRSRDGAWLSSRPLLFLPGCASDVSRHLESVTPLPVNLPPRHTVIVCRYLQIAMPKGADFETFVRDPFELEVELLGLSGRPFRGVLVKPQSLDALSEEMVEEFV
jgi:hypothetical protein